MHFIETYFPLQFRLIFGITFFIVMGILDYKKNPKDPKRLKEYLFILAMVSAACLFGIIHDVITYNISHEYFEYGKQLGKGVEFFPKVFILAIKASYTVGLLVGVIFIITNNPSKKMPQLNYHELCKCLVYPICISIACAILFGSLSNLFYPMFSIYFRAKLIAPLDYERVAFILWGTYIGALVGSVFSVLKIRKLRLLKLVTENV